MLLRASCSAGSGTTRRLRRPLPARNAVGQALGDRKISLCYIARGTPGMLARRLCDSQIVQFLAASAGSLAGEVSEFIRATTPSVVALTSVSPELASSLAHDLGYRYALECWDDPASGKAVLWQPSVRSGGVDHIRFYDPEGNRPKARGVLRVTLSCEGVPTNVFCVQLSAEPQESLDESVQLAQFVETSEGPSLIAIDVGGAAELPALRKLGDAWLTADLRSVSYGLAGSVDAAVRQGFGFADEGRLAGGEGGAPPFGSRRRIRLYHGSAFEVTRLVCHVAGTRGYALVATVCLAVSSFESAAAPAQPPSTEYAAAQAIQ